MGLDKLKDWYHRGKDASLSAVLEKILQERVSRYGRVSRFALDTREKSLDVELCLHGERDPVSVRIEEFELIEDPRGTSVVLKRVTASREWLQRAVEDFVIGKPFPIPQEYASWAKLLMK